MEGEEGVTRVHPGVEGASSVGHFASDRICRLISRVPRVSRNPKELDRSGRGEECLRILSAEEEILPFAKLRTAVLESLNMKRAGVLAMARAMAASSAAVEVRAWIVATERGARVLETVARA